MLRVNTGSGRVLRSWHMAILKPYSTYIRVLKIILTNKNGTNQDADQEYEAARRRLQQMHICNRRAMHCNYVTLYIADKANKRLGTKTIK